MKDVVRVGVREFRDDLARYLSASTPVAVTRRGRTVGYFLPAQSRAGNADAETLVRVVSQIEALLREHGVSEDEVVSEFRVRRARAKHA